MHELRLFGTAGCHLCAQAEALLEAATQILPALHWTTIDISEGQGLVERYGVRIPVLSFENEDRELDWPFNLNELLGFIQSSTVSTPINTSQESNK